jgi:glycosyltransferase involved in cell wall biosynthesis
MQNSTPSTPRDAPVDDRCKRNLARLPATGAIPSLLGRVRRFTAKVLPIGTRRGRYARSVVQRARRLRGRFRPGLKRISLSQILRENRNRKGIVIYPPLMDWTWMRQRPHQLMAQFARAGYLAIFCSPKKGNDRFDGFARVEHGLYLCDNLDSLRDLCDPILLVSWAPHWDLIPRFRSPVVIYDYLDDLRVGTGGDEPDPARVELHRKLLARSEIVLATARRLHDEVRRVRPDAIFCPNGVDYHHFHLTAPAQVPADIADMVRSGKPIIGYYGALAEWFDYDLVEHVASARKDWHFVLIGIDFDGTLHRHGRLLKMPNVRWLGEKTYEELPAYLQQFTVATIPFVINEVTKSTSPVKLFEYMAGGKPIVTTDMPECRDCPGVAVARNSAEYLAMLDRAIDDGQRESHRRLLDQQARANTWESRMGELVARIETTLGDKRRLSA